MRSVFIFALLLSACASGPKDNRSSLESLNGENYDRPAQVMGIPVLERKTIARTFSGNVLCGTGISQFPANHASITLLKNAQRVAKASTGADGGFQLNSTIEPNNAYALRANAKCGTASRTLNEKELLGLTNADFFIK